MEDGQHSHGPGHEYPGLSLGGFSAHHTAWNSGDKIPSVAFKLELCRRVLGLPVMVRVRQGSHSAYAVLSVLVLGE
jgi:hypothetical protein